MLAKFGQDGLDLPDKDTCIPYIVPISEIVLCSAQIGFFDETFSEKGTMPMSIAYLVGKTDIAIARFWSCWLNADSDKISCFRQFIGQVKCLSKCLNLGNHVISTKNRHNAFRIFAGN